MCIIDCSYSTCACNVYSIFRRYPGTNPPFVPLQGITPALTILKEGLIGGSPDEKEEAARVLVEVIRLASSKTLSTGKVHYTSVQCTGVHV